LAKGYGFSAKDAGRLATALKRDERRYRNPSQPSGPPPYPVGFPFLIPCNSGDSGVEGGTSETIKMCNPEDGTGNEDIDVFNPYPHSDVPPHALVWVTPGLGKFYCVVWDCQATWNA
jgi:hypothetical protein